MDIFTNPKFTILVEQLFGALESTNYTQFMSKIHATFFTRTYGPIKYGQTGTFYPLNDGTQTGHFYVDGLDEPRCHIVSTRDLFFDNSSYDDGLCSEDVTKADEHIIAYLKTLNTLREWLQQ